MTPNDPFISRQIDLNLNIGQGYYEQLIEKELLPYATSVNISTGAHVGDPACIDQAIKYCKEFDDIVLGALISYPDPVGYGLRRMQLTNEELRASIISQLGSLAALAKANSFELQHVRAHGYLYQQMASNYSIAETVAKSIQEFSKWLILVAPASSILTEVGSWTNIRIAFEARFDRRYRADGLQQNFDTELDLNLELDTIAQRARDLVYKSVVKADDGQEVAIKFETIHLATKIKNSLEAAKLVKGMILKPLPLKSVDYEPYLSEFI